MAEASVRAKEGSERSKGEECVMSIKFRWQPINCGGLGRKRTSGDEIRALADEGWSIQIPVGREHWERSLSCGVH